MVRRQVQQRWSAVVGGTVDIASRDHRSATRHKKRPRTGSISQEALYLCHAFGVTALSVRPAPAVWSARRPPSLLQAPCSLAQLAQSLCVPRVMLLKFTHHAIPCQMGGDTRRARPIHKRTPGRASEAAVSGTAPRRWSHCCQSRTSTPPCLTPPKKAPLGEGGRDGCIRHCGSRARRHQRLWEHHHRSNGFGGDARGYSSWHFRSHDISGVQHDKRLDTVNIRLYALQLNVTCCITGRIAIDNFHGNHRHISLSSFGMQSSQEQLNYVMDLLPSGPVGAPIDVDTPSSVPPLSTSQSRYPPSPTPLSPIPPSSNPPLSSLHWLASNLGAHVSRPPVDRQ